MIDNTNNKVSKVILFRIPMSICNLRCHYCYLAQRPIHYEGIQPEMKYSPKEVAEALNVEKFGKCFMNFCADGETLLTKDIDKYVYELVKEGHYAEIVSNCLITPMIEKFLTWPKELLKRIEFKCSFHYLELKRRNKLTIFAENVNKIYAAGASINIETVPSDELIPYIEELKEFSIKNFGALPHLTIARDDRTDSIDYLTNLSEEEYDKIWGEFDSSFWRFKKTIFGKKQTKFCYAGAWSYYVDLCTGDYTNCYFGSVVGNLFDKKNIDKPLPYNPVGKCKIAHCYNGHALLTFGNIPHHNTVHYGDIRNRIRKDGTMWLQPELLEFFNSKLEESNIELSTSKKISILAKDSLNSTKSNLSNHTPVVIKKFIKNALKS